MKPSINFKKTIFLAVFVSALFFISANAFAVEIKVEKVEKKPIIFTPQITIPGSEIFKKGVPFTVTKETMPIMARDLYRFLVGSAGIVAVIVMMAGGYYWLFAGGNTARVGQAKDYIGGAVVGLTLAIGSYMILNMINPDLINMKNFEIPIVPKITVLGIIECPADNNLVTISQNTNLIITSGTSDPRLIEGTKKALEAASFQALNFGKVDGSEKKYILQIKSAHRPPDFQKGTNDCYLSAMKAYGKDGQCPTNLDGKNWKELCKGLNPSCNLACKGDGGGNFCSCPHVTGQAVDLCLFSTDDDAEVALTCKQLKREYNGKNPYQAILQRIMECAGFRRIKSEWWHFEYPPIRNDILQSKIDGGCYKP